MSSTYYDLKHLRSSIENFVESLGYEPVLSEKDNIAFVPDAPLDESCYREAKSSDIYVLIVGGRYGSEVSAEKMPAATSKTFFDRYESITKHEYLSAIERNIPAYILIDAAVDAEYQTFLKNKNNTKINYAHVDSINIFHLIEDIRQRKQNNPVKLFARYSEIEDWLREQWAGLFRELIHRMSTASQIQDIDVKIGELAETSETLKRYLEEVVTQVSKQKTDASDIIKQENERLKDAKKDADILANAYFRHLYRSHTIPIERIRRALTTSQSYADFVDIVFGQKPENCHASHRAFLEVNAARAQFELAEFAEDQFEKLRDQFQRGKRATKRKASSKTVARVVRKKSH